MTMHTITTAAELAALKPGQPVTITDGGGRSNDVTVTRAWRRTDGSGFGSTEHGAVTVGYGPGRWNTEVSAAGIKAGRYALTTREDQ